MANYLPKENCCPSEVVAVDLSDYEELIRQLAEDIKSGKIDKNNLSVDLVKKTYKDLSKGATKGWGNDFNELTGDNPPGDKTVQHLHQNIYRFSGAKTAAQAYEISQLLYTEDGKIRPKKEFMELVLKLNERYNRHYLETEYNTAIKAATMARQWVDFQQDAELFPNLKYKTAGDSRVRPEHQKLNGTIRPLNDPFWNKYYPPNGWNCRCYVVQTAETVTEGREDDSVPKEFYGHVGKEEVVFSKNQTYFKVVKELGEGEFNKHFETAKLDAPYLNLKGVKVNIWADLEDYKENLDAALVLKKAGYEVKLRPHVNSSILLNTPNPEYEINGQLAERKAPKGVNLRNVLSKANKQGCKIVVIDMVDSKASLEEIQKEAEARLNDPEKFPRIEEILIVNEGKTFSVKRKKQSK
ncbi:hypothetical protein ETU08_01830 [Apibacter muscae]|uniref:Phage head morphogenesis domain-containing protein n=1 Tax=Apibacter muscae TaxID=2509004 RepID=A0A563DL42_9FLAO|nr:phage minor head protein [Apibacter muscae]TWP30524.1 hypothetical protein ETU09_00555 [Apibacter muscae]TWP31245.1 hypothetical protein ETU08_01830 [Apibacter muscae]